MSNATAPSPMRSLLLALLMITSTMTAALTTLPWMIDEARADPTFDGSDASGNSSLPSQVTTFNMQLNGTLDSTDQGDWYYVELFSGDSVDFEASCMYSNCGTMMSFEPGTQGSMSYSLTTNSSDVNYSFTNYGSTTYNLTFGFENWALQNVSTYLFTIDMTPSNNTGGGNSSNGTSQNDMGTGGDVTSTQATSFFTTHSGTVGGNDSYDSYWVYLYPGNDIEFDANCANQVSCYIMLMANVASTNQSTYYNLTTNYSDSVFTYTNNLTYYDMVSFTFMSVYNTPEDYEFYIQVNNASGNGTGGNGSGNGTGGNGSGNNTGSWSPPTLSLVITELVDHGSATNYSIEFSIDDMDYNSTYSWAFMLLNESMDMVFEEEVQSASGNTSVSIEGPENFQGGGTILDDGCYVMAGFVHDDTAQIGIEPVMDFLSVGGGSCTSVFADVVNWPQQSGDPIDLDLMFVDLDLYSNYTVSYEIKNATSLVASGNLTTYAESDMYNQVYNVSSQGLAVDCYEVHVELYDDTGNLVVPAFMHVDEAHFELGNPTCGSPDIHVWTDDYSYNAGDGVEVTIETVNLDDEETYNVYWSLYEAGTYVNGSSFSVSNADWAENVFTIWGLTWDGCFDLHVNLTDDYGNHFNSKFHQFEMGSGCSPSYPWIDVWSYDYTVGDSVSVNYSVGDLMTGHSYYIEWQLYDKEDWNLVDHGHESLGTPNVTMWESNINIGSLEDGCYHFEAELFGDENNGTWMDHSDTGFSVGDVDCNPLHVWIDGKDFDSGDNASFAIFVDNMMNMSNHTIRVELHKHQSGLESTSQWDFTAYGESTELNWDFGQLGDGCYAIEVYLLSDDGDFARSGHGFSVGDVNCAHPWIELHSDRTTFTSGNDVWFDMTFYDFPVNQTVDMDYELWSDDIEYTDFGMFSVNISSWNESYTYNLGSLPDGCYEISLTDVAGEMDHHLTARFVVGNSTDEEGNYFACWHPSIHIESADDRHDYSDTEEVDVVIKIDGLHDSIGYYVHWEVLDDESSQHENGSYTVNGVTSAHEELSLGPFAADGRCLELNVFLYEEGESWDIAYSDWKFEIGDADCHPPQVEVWAHGSEDWDENENVQMYLEMDIRAWDLDDGQEYNILWSVYDEDDTLVDDGEVNEFSWNHDLNYRYELYNLSEGCYDVEVYLYDNEWNLLSEDDEEKVGLGEVNCWAEPGVSFYYDDSRGQLQFGVWDLRHNDTYLLSYEIYEIDSNGNQSNNIGGGSFEFTHDDNRWKDYKMFVTLDEGEYWVEVILSEAFGGDDLADSDGYIYVGDNSEEVWIEFFEENDDHIFETGEISFNVGIANLDEETDYILEILLLSYSQGEREIEDEYYEGDLSNGYYEYESMIPLDDGFYEIEVQLLELDTNDWRAGDSKGICAGQGCPTGENLNGEASMVLTVNWYDRPGSEEYNMGDCDWLEVQLIPEQRWLDHENGDATYGPYPDWSEHAWGWGDSFTEFEFEFYELPEGEYYVNVKIECSGEIDGEWVDYQGVTDHKDENTWVPMSFIAYEETSTYHTVDLHTVVHDHHDGGDDGGMSEFVEPYIDSFEWIYRATIREGPDGTELHLEMEMSLSTDIIAMIDEEMGDGDGLISQDEMDMLMLMMMEGDEFEWDENGEEFYWGGLPLGEIEFQVEGERIFGLVEENPVFVEFMIFSLPVADDRTGVLGLFSNDDAGEPLCEDDEMPEDWRISLFVGGVDGWIVEGNGLNSGLTFDNMDDGYHRLILTCDDVFPGTLEFNAEHDENWTGTDPGTDPTDPGTDPEVNTPPFCYIEWYRDGDDMSGDGMAIFTAGDSVEDIRVTAGETFSVYFECEDPDGDEMTLIIAPPFGSEVNFSAQGNVNRFVQLTIPSGTQGSFDFTAEWYDAASGGEYDFKVIIEAPEEGEETEEDSTSAASFVPGFSAVLSFTALLGAVIMLALRREDEE